MYHFNVFQTKTVEIRRHRRVYKCIRLIQIILQCIIFNVFKIPHTFQIRKYSKWSARTLEISRHKCINKCIHFYGVVVSSGIDFKRVCTNCGLPKHKCEQLGGYIDFILISFANTKYIPTQLRTNSPATPLKTGIKWSTPFEQYIINSQQLEKAWLQRYWRRHYFHWALRHQDIYCYEVELNEPGLVTSCGDICLGLQWLM